MIDATGQDAFLARANRTVQPLKGFGCVAVFRHYDGIAPGDLRGADRQREHQGADGSRRLDVADPAGGAAPLRRASSAGTRSRAPEETLDKAIAASPIIQRLIAGAVGDRAAHHPQLQLPQPAAVRPALGLHRRRVLLSRSGLLIGRVAGDAGRRVAGRQAVARAARGHRGRSRSAGRAREADGDRLPDLRRESLPLLSRGAGATGCSSRRRRASRCAPGSPACSARTSGATTTRSSRCC